MIALDRLVAIVGEAHVLIGEDARARGPSWAPEQSCPARAVVRPADSAEIAAVIRACAAARQAIVPQGGRTGLSGGEIASSDDIVLSLERLTKVEVRTTDRVAIVGAGATIQQVQEAADEAGLSFGVDFGARGSATVGGAISTNAGGNRVLRFGMMRDQVLGIDAILADGTHVDAMKGLVKDNSGFDVKQLFVGSEGMFGIVSGAVLRLRPKLGSRQTALATVSSFSAVLEFLTRFERSQGGRLSAFEIMWPEFYAVVSADRPRLPLPPGAPYYLLVECEGGAAEPDAASFEVALAQACDDALLDDVVIAQSERERSDLWALRDNVAAIFRRGDHLDFDVSLPASAMEAYVTEVRSRLAEAASEADILFFGHVADNNLHVAVSRGAAFEPDEASSIKQAVYAPLGPLRGSISAEHGIGLFKKPYLALSRRAAELALMRSIKHALDPHNLLNPGKIID